MLTEPALERKKYEKNNQLDLAKDEWINALAYYEMGILQGDKESLLIGIDTMNRNSKITFSEKEKQEITRRARAALDNIEARRSELGISVDYDIPKAATNLYNLNLKKLTSNNSGWGSQYYDTGG